MTEVASFCVENNLVAICVLVALGGMFIEEIVKLTCHCSLQITLHKDVYLYFLHQIT